MPDGDRKKIAILGGGAGALSAAFGITEQPDWQTRYEITVYQLGWRLGGKGASGCNASANQRIQEHGLHVWAGFYENGFRLMRRCYQELGRSPDQPLASWQDAFKPHSFVTVMEYFRERWIPWHVTLPTNPALPGDGGPLPTPWEYIRLAIQWMVDIYKDYRAALLPLLGDLGHLLRGPEQPEELDRVVREAETGLDTAGAVAEVVDRSAPETWPLQQALRLSRLLPRDLSRHTGLHHDALRKLLDEFMAWLGRLLQGPILEHDGARRLWMLLDFAAAHVRGMLADHVISNGFDSIDHVEWSEWLRKHGASELTLRSPMVRGTYDYIFGFAKGDTSQPAVGAGTCIRGLLRLTFTYKGAIFWKMQAGMGDAVFAPLYEVLKRRGVKFQFFHRVRNLGLSPDQSAIATIELGRQARLNAAEYNPLVDVKGLPCWPATPRYDQIQEGTELEARKIDLESAWTPWQDVESQTLRAGQDFDLVVLGISLAALKDVCPELIAASERWQNMVEKVQTVQTQALQLWLKPDAKGLGWERAPALLTAYEEPQNTWADLSHLLPREDWPPDGPQSLAYFCGPLQDPAEIPPYSDTGFPEREKNRVKQIAIDWLVQNIGRLWPNAATAPNAQGCAMPSFLAPVQKLLGRWAPPGPKGMNWELLEDPNEGAGLARFDSQYWRANVNPTDRYVLSVPGSSQHRLKAGESGFANLYLAGDWVGSGINAGCVEAAVMAGFQAARAICGNPQEIPGETDL